MSSSLTVLLSAAGGLVLAGFVAHGAWTARKAGPKRASPPVEPTMAPEDGPGLGVEPVFMDPPSEPGESADVQPFPVDHAAEAKVAEAPVMPVLSVPRKPSVRIDALIDAIASFTLDAPISGEMAQAHLPATRRAGTKPFLVEGRNAESGEWEPVAPGQRYSEFQAGVQLANRTGALNEIEYSEFVQKLQAFADPVGAMADFPDMLDVVGRARELDAFAGQYDAQLVVHLQARSAAWSPGYLQQHGAQHGFLPGSVPGRLVMPAAEDGAPPVLTLGYDAQAALAEDPNQSAVTHVALSFDVPQTAAENKPFDAWQKAAEAFAADIDGAIVDDNGRPLAPAGFEAIGKELGQLYDALAERDLAAGSPAARRLFS
jgi:hypothetical protein